MPTKRQEQKEATRQLIIKTAMDVYAQYGFSVPTSLIAKQAGLAHGSVFAHFPTVEDLVSCVLQTFFDDLGLRLHNLSSMGCTIEELLSFHLSVLEEHEALYKRIICETALLPKDTQISLISAQSVVSYHLSKALEKGIAEGTIKNVPLHMLFNTWLGLVHYYLQNSELFSPNDSVLRRYKGELIGCYTALIKQEETR